MQLSRSRKQFDVPLRISSRHEIAKQKSTPHSTLKPQIQQVRPFPTRMSESNPLAPTARNPAARSYDRRFENSSKLRGTSKWKSARGFDRKAHTMRNPPPDDEQRNWFTEEFYDLMTVTNVAATGYDSEHDFENKRTIMRACISRLNDKFMGAEARINALDIVAALLMNSRSPELINNLHEELFDGVVSTFSSSNTSEDELFRGLRVLALLSLHEGLHSDGYVRKLLQHIGLFPERYQTAEQIRVDFKQPPPLGSRPPPYHDESVRCQALATIAIATFFCADDELLILQALDIVESVLCRHSHATGFDENGLQGVDENTVVITEPVRGAAADAWCLIAMRLEPTLVFSRVQTKVLHAFRNLLFSVDIDTRIAGGEAICFLLELAQESSSDDDAAEIWLAPDGDIWEDIVERTEFLSGEYYRRFNRRERREQHKMFRAFYKTLTEGRYPLEVLKLPDSQMAVETWGGVKILDMIRHFMGAGFHEGLFHFPSVQTVLAMPDWMRKVVSRTRTAEDEQADRLVASEQHYWIDDGSSLPNARASRKYQNTHKGNKHSTSTANEMFPREYDVAELPPGRNV